MQRYERLMEIGIACPVCGSPVKIVVEYSEWCWSVASCTGCDSEGPCRSSPATALAAWIALTGGPIPGEILPPMETPEFSQYVWGRGPYELGVYGVVWIDNGEWTTTTGGCVDAPKFWSFIAIDEAKISAWLEEEVSSG